MYAYEIEDFTKKKIRRDVWGDKSWVHLNSNGFWLDQNGNRGDYVISLFKYNDWEEYKEPKEKKRYWLWSVEQVFGWYMRDNYLDENGYNTEGALEIENFDNLEKIKHEDMYINI